VRAPGFERPSYHWTTSPIAFTFPLYPSLPTSSVVLLLSPCIPNHGSPDPINPNLPTRKKPNLIPYYKCMGRARAFFLARGLDFLPAGRPYSPTISKTERPGSNDPPRNQFLAYLATSYILHSLPATLILSISHIPHLLSRRRTPSFKWPQDSRVPATLMSSWRSNEAR
jgi:hypothetical protein